MSEDEPEARLKVAEEVDRLGSAEREWIRRGGILVALLSDHDVFQNFILPKLSRGDVSMLTRVNRACRNGVREMVDQALGWKLSVKDFVVFGPGQTGARGLKARAQLPPGKVI